MRTTLVALLFLAACTKAAPSTSPTGDTTTPPTGGTSEPADPVENTGGDPTQAGGECDADDDCVVSCSREGDCCNQLCDPCEQVFTREALEAHEQWVSQSCAATSCPVARCAAPKEQTFARCDQGTCVLDRRAL